MPEKRKSFVNRLGERARDSYDTAGEKINEATDKARDTISESPLKSVLIAVAVGAVVGYGINEIVHRARRKERSNILGRIRGMF